MVSEEARAARFVQGPCLLGIFLNVLLYGSVIVQAGTYYARSQRDPTWVKLYVAVLLLADTLNTIFNVTWIYNVLINNFGDISALMKANWLNASEHAMAGIIATMVQMFYARRILLLTKNKYITALVVITSYVSGFCAIGTAIAVGMSPEFSHIQSLKAIILPWVISCTICDVTIATTLSVYLSKQKTGFEQTDSVIKKIIFSTISNGLLTASFTTSHIISYLASKSGIHMIFNYGVVKLYTNSVISSLNSRKADAKTTSGNSLLYMDKPECSSVSKYLKPEVKISVETHEMVDIGPLPRDEEEVRHVAKSQAI